MGLSSSEGREEGLEPLDRVYELLSSSGGVEAARRGDRSMQQRPGDSPPTGSIHAEMIRPPGAMGIHRGTSLERGSRARGDSVAEVGHARGVDHADDLQTNRSAYVVEQANPTTKQQRHHAELDLVQ